MDEREKTIRNAWATFVATGEVPEGEVRPEIAASWLRCRKAGLDPWSYNFEESNTVLLKEKQHRFRKSIEAVEPVAKVLMTLLYCNVSLMDGENFVFYLDTPYSSYPRTLGTFMHEDLVGTGNATLVAHERKPVRCDGFENYRVVSQAYSAVSVPYLDRKGRYIGAMNLNSPTTPLPQCALDLCQVGVEMSQRIFLAADRSEQLLASADFFKPLLLLCDFPVAIFDEEGHLLAANAAMDVYCPGWEDAPYGTVSIGEYLAKGTSVKDLVGTEEDMLLARKVSFKKKRSKAVRTATLLRRGIVSYRRNEPFVVCVFSDEEATGAPARPESKRRVEKAISVAGETIDYVGQSPAWREVDGMVDLAAPTMSSVLLLGETGTGKEMVARAIHRRSGRKGHFVPINCGSLPRDLLATELFGYEQGAFTGARDDGALGKFEYADGGTLFLDEIGEMPLDMQASLLRFLQDHTITRLGSNTQKVLDVRVVAATNCDLEQLISERRFRSDLFYRLSLIEIVLPPLRVRKGDVALLANYFNEQISEQMGCPFSPFSDDVIRAFEGYSWPGNVRELRNVVERNLIMAGEGAKVTLESLAPHFRHGSYTASKDSNGFLAYSVPRAYGESDVSRRGVADGAQPNPEAVRFELAKLLSRNNGDVAQAAKEVGLTTEALVARMNQAGLRMHVVFD